MGNHKWEDNGGIGLGRERETNLESE